MLNRQATDGREAGSSSPPLLRFSSANLGTFLEISSDAHVLINQAGIIVMVNQQAEALFGYPRAQLLEQPLEQLLPERFRDGHRQHLARYFSTPRPRPMEAGLSLIGLRQDGTEFPLDISLKPLLLDEKLVALAAIRDLSIQRHMDQVRLNKILSATEENVHLIDRHGRFLFTSDNAAQLYGLSPSDFVGKTWQELSLPAEYVAPFEAQRQAVMSTGQTVVDEILSPISTGERWFEYVLKPMPDRQGAIASVIVVSRDITERRRAADAVRQLASIVESSGEAIISNTPEGVITSWNHGAETLFGYRAEEIIGQSDSLLISPDDQQELGNIEARTRLGQQPIKGYETLWVRKDGTQVAVSITLSPILNHQGRLIGTSTIAHDISEQKRIVEDLARRNSELERAHLATSQLAAIVESSSDAILSKTLEGVITSWNRGAPHLYGYGADEVLGKSLSLIVPPDRQEELANTLERIRVGAAIQRYETVRVRKDGTLIEVSVTVSPIRDIEGRIVGALSMPV